MSQFYVYIVTCSDNTLYTGITTDISRRLKEHNLTTRGAKYTRSRRPVTLAYCRLAGTRSEALVEEHRIKKLKRSQKICIIKENNKKTE
jgi:putative endonuclease